MPPKTSKKATTTPVVENKPNVLESLKSEWLEVTQELLALNKQTDVLNSRKDELVTLMLKEMNSSAVTESSSIIIETPAVEITPVAESTVKTSKSKTKNVVDEKPIEKPVKKASAKKAAKEEEVVVTVVKKPVSKKPKVAEVEAPKATGKNAKKTPLSKIKLEEDDVKLNSSSSDTDLESLSSCSSESECSGGEDD
jgi:hypothetical protein